MAKTTQAQAIGTFGQRIAAETYLAQGRVDDARIGLEQDLRRLAERMAQAADGVRGGSVYVPDFSQMFTEMSQRAARLAVYAEAAKALQAIKSAGESALLGHQEANEGEGN